MAAIEKLDPNDLTRFLGPWSSGDGPLYIQLASALENLIVEGVLRDGVVLPPERKLSSTLSVSRSTVVGAYERLQANGWINRKQGSGTTVTANHAPGPERRSVRSGSFFGSDQKSTALLQACPPCSLDLSAELTSLAANPQLTSGTELLGLEQLRRMLAERYSKEGLPTKVDQILITNGCQQATTLLLVTLCKPGDVVIVEDPSWPGLTDAVNRMGARAHGIGMDNNGVNTEALRSAVERLRPSLIVVNPHHHNPTTTRLVPHRRQELADISADYSVPIVEDRVFAALAYDGIVPPPLATLRSDAQIITADSLSKTIWYGLRVGWVRAAPDLIGRLKLQRAVDDLGSSVIPQLLACQLLERYDELISERIETMKERAAIVGERVSELFPDWTYLEPKGGCSLWVRLPQANAREFSHHAARHGIVVITDETFSLHGGENQYLRLPYSADKDDLFQALELLAMAWRTFNPELGATGHYRPSRKWVEQWEVSS